MLRTTIIAVAVLGDVAGVCGCGAASGASPAVVSTSRSHAADSAPASQGSSVQADGGNDVGRCNPAASVSGQPYWPGSVTDQATPRSLYQVSCEAWLPSQLQSQLNGANYGAGRQVTPAQAAENWCWSVGLNEVVTENPMATSPPDGFLATCRAGIAAAGGSAPAADTPPVGGPGTS